ncbi:MAG: hypothetical protein ABR886_07750 [Dehalococcoidales bacterium]|jgi:hypothetical protein
MASSLPADDSETTRQDKREEKLRKKRAKIKQHGKGLGKIYKDAVEKREK